MQSHGRLARVGGGRYHTRCESCGAYVVTGSVNRREIRCEVAEEPNTDSGV